MRDGANSPAPMPLAGTPVGALAVATIVAAAMTTLLACGDTDPRDIAGDWAKANAECGTDAVRRAYALERRRGDEDPLDARLREAREKPCRADGPKPEVKETALVDERDDLVVVRVAYLHFPGSATSTESVVLVKSSGGWKVDTAQSRPE